MIDMKKINGKFPTIHEAYGNLGAVGRAMQAGAREINAEKHIWFFNKKLVTQEFLEDYFTQYQPNYIYGSKELIDHIKNILK